MSKVEIIQNVDQAIEVMHNAGVWMAATGLNPSKWWKPENMNYKFMVKHAEPDEFYVAMVDGKPVASMVLQDTERNQSWKSVDGNKPKKALYVHWLCVHRDFAGQGLPKKMIAYVNSETKKRGFKRLRLDTDAGQQKLCKIYESLGFTLMGTEAEGEDSTAYFEKKIV